MCICALEFGLAAIHNKKINDPIYLGRGEIETVIRKATALVMSECYISDLMTNTLSDVVRPDQILFYR